MHTGKGRVNELILRDGLRHARITCAGNLIPSPGQYVLASAASDAILSLSKGSPLPDPVFHTDSSTGGFTAAPAPDAWMPGLDLSLRGPLGRGYDLPASARKIALAAVDGSVWLLSALIEPALRQGGAVVAIDEKGMDSLPDAVEVQPVAALHEVARWADWMALVAEPETLPGLKERLGEQNRGAALQDAQILIRTPMPCGGIADCSVCAVTLKSGWRLACKDGPVFRWSDV